MRDWATNLGMKMRQILYVSNTPLDIAAEELSAILKSSRTNNMALDVTGMLLHIDGGFLQILEGEDEVLRDLYIRIAADDRHYDARILVDRDVPRAFHGWSMGFRRLTGQDADAEGIFSITREAIEGKLAPGAGRAVVTMLETFYRIQTGETLRLRKAG